MVSPVNFLPNEEALKKCLATTEASFGAGGTPTFQMYGDLVVNKKKPLVRTSDEYRGSFSRLRNPRRGPTAIDGTFNKQLSYEDLAILVRYFLKSGGGTPADDGNTVHGYTRTAAANDNALDSWMAEHFVDGLPFVAKGIRMNEITISADVDDANGNWMLASSCLVQADDLKATTSVTATGGTTGTAIKAAAGWTVNEHAGKYLAARSGTAANIGSVVQVASNDATTLTFTTGQTMPAAVASGDVLELSGLFTTGIADRTIEYILAEDTKLYIGDAVASLAEVPDKLVSWSVTIAHNFSRKKFQGSGSSYALKQGRGERIITAQMVMEFDDWFEYKKWDTATPSDRAVRFKTLGSTIDSGAATQKLAQITLPRLQWDEINPNNQREGNITAVYQAVEFVDAVNGELEIVTKTKLATLP